MGTEYGGAFQKSARGSPPGLGNFQLNHTDPKCICAVLCAQVHGKTYYIDRGNFEHAELLERLVPGKHTQAEESEASDEHKESEASDEHEPQDQRSQPGSGKS